MTKDIKYVVVIGTAFGNKVIYGPFNYESAERWITENTDFPSDIVPLKKP